MRLRIMRWPSITASLILACVSLPVFAAQDVFVLSKKCPKTGLYQDDEGNCRPVQPYSQMNADYHGLWKLKPIDLKLRPEAIDLGRLLFFDPILSQDQSKSCATCHEPSKAFSGTHLGLRSSPGLINLAYNPKFFWDGRADTAAEQLSGPLLSPMEMGNSSIKELLNRLNQNELYRKLFATLRTKKHSNHFISWDELVFTLDSFQKSLITFTAPYDHYMLGDSSALNSSQIKGLSLFRSFATRCAECHTPPLFTNHEILTVGAPGEPRSFKVPTLRQIAKTAPYTHRGAFETLLDVVKFYNEGGGRSKKGISGVETHWHVRPIGLSPQDEIDLAEFLTSLTDDQWKVEIPKYVPSGLSPKIGP